MISLCGQQIFNTNTITNAILFPEEEINTTSFEFSPTFYGEYIAFVYDKGNALYYDDVYDTPFFDLAFAAKNTIGNLARKASFVNNLSSEFQEGPFAFYDNFSKILFTRTDPISGKLNVYFSELIEGEWAIGSKLSLLGDNFHVCHPSVSENGKLLVFAAAPIMGEADMDLYSAEFSNGEWININRLPEGINSKNNDWFPRFAGDSIIVYASNRAGGLGGLDLYATKLSKGIWQLPEHAPAPLNSSDDDLGLVVNKGIAYFSSDRAGTKGRDDLYRIEFKGNLFYNPNEELLSVQISIKDKLSLLPIEGVRATILPLVKSLDDIDLEDYQINLIQDNQQGEILLKLKPKGAKPSDIAFSDKEGIAILKSKVKQNYLLELSADGYAKYMTIYNFESLGDNITLVMEPNEKNDPEVNEGIVIPTTAGAVVVFNNLYYDFNSHNIRQGAAQELDALVNAMNENPNMIVQLSAHTDSRGTKLYNQKLSEKRASSARDYLINKGISPTRITTLGYGESQIRNHCEDGVFCSDEEHSYNRRTEVKIINN
jgi:outer membrane protein OmpA-like peptidoglycan-associated protein